MTLKSKTFSGFKWSLIDTFFRYFLTFFIGIVLARLLSPTDYGLVGMSSIFVAISRVFIDAGFSDALIRKNDCTNDDYSSVLIFNLIVALAIYGLLFELAVPLSVFFNEPLLVNIIRITGLGLIIGATSSIHIIFLKKKLDFRKLAIVGFIATIASGIVAISMASYGYAFWSIIFSGLIQNSISSIILWIICTDLNLKFKFNFNVIKENFDFGYKIMIGSLIHVIYNNMYLGFVGKMFNVSTLGYYTRADNFQRLFSDNIDTVVRQVTYPVLSQLKEDETKLKSTYKVMLKSTTFLSLILLVGLIVVSKSFIYILIGSKWLPSVYYLQLLCLTGILMPILSINLNILNVVGRSDLTLKIVTYKVLLSIPSLFLGYFFGLYQMIFGILISIICTYFIATYFVNKFLNYSLFEQLSDVLPSFKLVLFAFGPVYIITLFLSVSYISLFFIQLLLCLMFLIILGEYFNNSEYLVVKRLLFSRFKIT